MTQMSADKKPEKYTDPKTGKVRIRMVRFDQNVQKDKKKNAETEVEVSEKKKTDRWYKDQPEWGTPESDKMARKKTPGQSGCNDVKEMDAYTHRASRLDKIFPKKSGEKKKPYVSPLDVYYQKMKDKEKSNVKEMMTAGDAGIPQDTKTMGPRFKTTTVVDKRRRKDKHPVLLKRFRKYVEDNA